MDNITTWISENAADWGIQIGIAIAIFIIGKMIARKVSNLIEAGMRRSGTDELLVDFIGNISYAILVVAVILAAIDSLGVNVTSLMAVVAAAGLAIGLALKDSLSNFAAGVMIIIFRPFGAGDFITAGGASGVFDEIGLFATQMHTGDNQRIIVPNNALISGNIINTSALPTRRLDLVFGIGYGDDIVKAEEILTSILDNHELVLKDPEFMVKLHELADSSVNFIARPWVKTEDYWDVYWDVTRQVKERFDAEGISIPFPQRDVHLYQAAPPENGATRARSQPDGGTKKHTSRAQVTEDRMLDESDDD
jgi:small conductance mechanosensitive channel